MDTIALTERQLAQTELRLCQLVHPGWLDTDDEALRKRLQATGTLTLVQLACSRALVERHRLGCLGPAHFDAPWKFALLGGAGAVAAVVEQARRRLAARWARLAVDGAGARALRAELGADYEPALREWPALQGWKPPAEGAAAAGQTLARTAQRAFLALCRSAGAIAMPWWTLMLPPSVGAAQGEEGLPDLAELDGALSDDFRQPAMEGLR